MSLSLDAEPNGFGASQVFAAVIQDIEGYKNPMKVFEGLGFILHGGVLFNRCDGWSNGDQKFVKRDVQQMVLQKT